MQIDFNTSRFAKGDVSQPPVTRPEVSAGATETTSFTSAASLEAQLRDVPAVRTEKVALAKSLVANPNYPPQELLDRIAALLAVNNIQ